MYIVLLFRLGYGLEIFKTRLTAATATAAAAVTTPASAQGQREDTRRISIIIVINAVAGRPVRIYYYYKCIMCFCWPVAVVVEPSTYLFYHEFIKKFNQTIRTRHKIGRVFSETQCY